ncbi:hypothetical protein GCM10007190_03160 [Macrococcus hajekii]|nr:trypsin-like peptidase domain-containing protein [Macrococcus hajekii]GGA98509.1 hypothetical protein GCM10007190_03160 [Macrococcus hajekii]
MSKITIRKKDYFRPKRRFKHHEEEAEAAEKSIEESEMDESEIDEPAAKDREVIGDTSVAVREPVVEETIVHEVPLVTEQPDVDDEDIIPHKNEHSKFSWLYLIPAVLFGIALMMLVNLFMDQPEKRADKPAERPVTETLTKTEQAVKDTRSHVVSVVNMQKVNNLLNESAVPTEVGIGSGVIYKLTDKDAYIVTNFHVIKDAASIQVTLADHNKVAAQVVGGDMWTDLAVIKVPKGSISSYVKFADSDKIIVGQTAIAIGSPLSQTFAGSVSQGIISGLNRSVPVDLDADGIYDWESNVIQTDAAINPGNSGGALVNDKGELVGINAMKISLDNVEGISFAIPSNDVKKITALLEKEHHIVRPELGLKADDITSLQFEAVKAQLGLPADMTTGIIITTIEPGSAAEAAGLKTKDIITQLNGKKIDSMVQFRKELYYDHQPGDTLDLTVFSQGHTKHMKVTLK